MNIFLDSNSGHYFFFVYHLREDHMDETFNNKLVEELIAKFITDENAVRVSPSVPTAILCVVKPIVCRFVDLLEKDEDISEGNIRALLFCNDPEGKIDSSEFIRSLLPRLTDTDASTLDPYFESNSVVSSMKDCFFGDSKALQRLFDKKFDAAKQVQVFQLANFLINDIIENAIGAYFPGSHTPASYICTLWKAVHEELNGADDDSIQEKPYAYVITPSILYEVIFQDDLLFALFFPTVHHQLRASDVQQKPSIILPAEGLPCLSRSTANTQRAFAKLRGMLLTLISNSSTPFDYDPEPSEKAKELYMELLLQMRCLDGEWLGHYRSIILEHFPWEGLFSVGLSKADDKFWFEDVDFTRLSSYMGRDPTITSVHPCYLNTEEDTDENLHLTWPHIVTFFRACQEVLILSDIASTKARSPVACSNYAFWLRNKVSFYVSKGAVFNDATILLFAKDEMGETTEEESEAEHNRRMLYFTFFNTLGHSIFLPVASGPAAQPTVWDFAAGDVALIEELRHLRGCILEGYFFNQDERVVSRWLSSLAYGGKLSVLESFLAILAPPCFRCESEGGVLATGDLEADRVSGWTSRVFPGATEIVSSVANMMYKQYYFSLHHIPKLIDFFSTLQVLYAFARPRFSSSKCLIDASVEAESESGCADTLAHYILQSMPNGGNESRYLTHENWLVLLFSKTNRVKIADINTSDVLDRHRLPLLHTVVKLGNLALTRLLIETLGANIDSLGGMDDGNDEMFVTALSVAVLHRHEDIVAYLISKGAVLHPIDASLTPSPLVFAVQKTIHLIRGAETFSPAITQMLFDAGATTEIFI